MNQSEYEILCDIYKTKTASELNRIKNDNHSSPTEKKAANDILDYKVANGFSTNKSSKPTSYYNPQYKLSTKTSKDNRKPIKRSNIVIVIAILMLFFCIVGSIICFVACGNTSNDNAQMMLGVMGGYNLLQGIILFAIMYGIGHILKKNEEISETNKEIKDKMDKIIEVEMWKRDKK